MPKFIGFQGKSGSYTSMKIEGGDNADSVGDMIWFSNCGEFVEISDFCDRDVLHDISDLFSNKNAFIGACRRNGII